MSQPWHDPKYLKENERRSSLAISADNIKICQENIELHEKIKELEQKLAESEQRYTDAVLWQAETERKLLESEKGFKQLLAINAEAEKARKLWFETAEFASLKKGELETKLSDALELLREYNHYIKQDNAIARKIGTTVDDYFKKHGL